MLDLVRMEGMFEIKIPVVLPSFDSVDWQRIDNKIAHHYQRPANDLGSTEQEQHIL